MDEKRDPQSSQKTTTENEPGEPGRTPGQAEGTRESVEESLREQQKR